MEVIDPDYLPENFPYVWITNAVHGDDNICEAMLELAEDFPDKLLSVVDISHLFSKEYAALVFYNDVPTFTRFIDRLYADFTLCLRDNNSLKTFSYPKSELLRSARALYQIQQPGGLSYK